MGEELNCSEVFKPIITDEGVCYTFNMLDRSEIFTSDVYHYSNLFISNNLTYNNWSMENGYSADSGLHPYPRRALFAGAKNSLTVHLYASKHDIDSTCKKALQGFRVLLHTPMRVPRPSQQYFRVPLNEVVLAAIQPDMITTSNSVKLYNPVRRECYFPNEKKLKYFKIYTSLNCQLECLTNYTQYLCDCVDFFMPREKGTHLCGIGKLQCMINAEKTLQLGSLRTKLNRDHRKSNSSTAHSGEHFDDCNCMPMCSDLSYYAETSQSYWQWEDDMKTYTKDGSFKHVSYEPHYSKVIIFFKSAQFITSQRHELYGPTDFLANFGGLLGLFTGFSILSFMELIYFLTVRLCCNTRLYGYWAGPEN